MSPAHPAAFPLPLPRRIETLEVSKIAGIADLGRRDPDVIKLWIGEGDLPTPDFISNAAIAALNAGHTRYTYSRGIPEIHDALTAYHERHFGVRIDQARFSITPGGMNAIMQAFQAIIEPGDEVIVPTPAWPNTMQIAKVLGASVVQVPYRTEGGVFALDLGDLEAAITPRTKVISINSPSNPTGWVMPREQMIAVRDLARRRGVWILSDEVYNHFHYGKDIAPSFLQICTDEDALIVVNTFSKNWCMTGWRLGWVVFPHSMTQVFDNLSQYNSTSAATFLQYGAVAALNDGDGFIRHFVERCRRARDAICRPLEQLPNVQVFRPEATFYFFFSVDGLDNGYDVALDILKNAKVGVAPGIAFGEAGRAYMRVCFGVDPALAREGGLRLARYLGDT